MQQQSQAEVQARRIRPTRLVRHSLKARWQDGRVTTGVTSTIDAEGTSVSGRGDPRGRPALDVRPLPLDVSDEDIDISLLDTLHLLKVSGMLQAIQVEKQRTGAFPPISIHGHEADGRIVPFISRQGKSGGGEGVIE